MVTYLDSQLSPTLTTYFTALAFPAFIFVNAVWTPSNPPGTTSCGCGLNHPSFNPNPINRNHAKASSLCMRAAHHDLPQADRGRNLVRRDGGHRRGEGRPSLRALVQYPQDVQMAVVCAHRVEYMPQRDALGYRVPDALDKRVLALAIVDHDVPRDRSISRSTWSMPLPATPMIG
ncbi:hypothetical protein VTN77DRAFT_1529 [Rasamsonia byssochlamydoides]|uniref:uncharacterized protein n=1 Tax=Rasamsonia byssochlamydoides TaxID=89139 RepID=UPI003742EE6C